jgi:succinate dehydrogenase/fumarate reductase flavoprotein subunit
MGLIRSEDGKFLGCVAVCMEDDSIHRFGAHSTFIATGGFGRAYQSCTPTHTCTSDGSARASHTGLPTRDLEFVQPRPTGIFPAGCWLTEGCRSESGSSRNGECEPFMACYAPAAKGSASRDVVSRAMTLELRKGRGVGHNKDHVLSSTIIFSLDLQVSGALHSEKQEKTYSEHIVELLAQSWSRSQAHHGHFPAGGGKAAVSRRVVF